MLKITGYGGSGKTKSEFGEYLPFRFWCESASTDPRVYWRTGDLSSTLLEVEIDSANGYIVGASLLLPGKVSREFPELQFNANRAHGFPIVNLTEWTDKITNDEIGALKVFISSNCLLITFSPSLDTEMTIAGDDVTFGVDIRGAIIWILVSHLPAEKVIDLENL